MLNKINTKIVGDKKNKMYTLKLEIRELTIEDKETLLAKIDLIIHHVKPSLKDDLDYSMLKHSPNWISLHTSNLELEEAFELYKLLSQGLNFTHKDDDWYEVYTHPHMELVLEFKDDNIGG